MLAARLEQLVVKAAHHFGDAHVLVVSGWRERAGRHTSGEALDFKLQGVAAAQLAAYLRGLPRVGVGIYTHPKTQYVHLDVRDASYHWLDALAPRRHLEGAAAARPRADEARRVVDARRRSPLKRAYPRARSVAASAAAPGSACTKRIFRDAVAAP